MTVPTVCGQGKCCLPCRTKTNRHGLNLTNTERINKIEHEILEHTQTTLTVNKLGVVQHTWTHTGPQEDLLMIIKRRKLQWYGHVSRSSGRPKPSCKAQWKGEEDKANKGRGGKTTSGNGQAWSSASPRGQWRTGKNGENWLQNHLWCSNDPRS